MKTMEDMVKLQRNLETKYKSDMEKTERMYSQKIKKLESDMFALSKNIIPTYDY